jgi:methylated-DNA-[protein]-cysteine S-methyltransferase
MPPRPTPGQEPEKDEHGFAKIGWMPRPVIACANTGGEGMGIRTEGEVLAEIMFLPPSMGTLPPLDRLAERACAQIEKYADDPEFRFRLPLKTVGTDFQRRVWAAIAAVPCGQTLSYGRMARSMGSAARAVGQACGSNFFPLAIPCHRVIAATGLGGFAHNGGGYLIEVKRRLLAHEGVIPGTTPGMARGRMEGQSGNLF